MIEELYLMTRLADLEREFDAYYRQSRLQAQLRGNAGAGPFGSAATVPMTHPWGEPGHEFVGRRRVWLHNLVAAARTDRASTTGES
jgi:hypothetical protein